MAACSFEQASEPQYQRRAPTVNYVFGAVTTSLLLVLLQRDMTSNVDIRAIVLPSSARAPVSSPMPSAQTSRTCNRIHLPSHYVNETQGPYNPAAIRVPGTGEWLAVFRLDEVCSMALWLSKRSCFNCRSYALSCSLISLRTVYICFQSYSATSQCLSPSATGLVWHQQLHSFRDIPGRTHAFTSTACEDGIRVSALNEGAEGGADAGAG